MNLIFLLSWLCTFFLLKFSGSSVAVVTEQTVSVLVFAYSSSQALSQVEFNLNHLKCFAVK